MGAGQDIPSSVWRELERIATKGLDDVEASFRRPSDRADGSRCSPSNSLIDGFYEKLAKIERVKCSLAASGTLAKAMLLEQFSDIGIADVVDILISAVKEIALVYGATVVAGASLGFLVGGPLGAGAGAMAGAAVGTWILSFLGLKSLAEHFYDALPQVTSAYASGFKTAWSHPSPVLQWGRTCSTPSSQEVEQATHQFAHGHVVLVGLILAAIVAYLTRGKGDKAKLLTEIRSSTKLGPRVAKWIETNEAKLVRHRRLAPPSNASAASGSGSRATPQTQPKPTAKRITEPTVDMSPGSPAHKADRWQKYQDRGGTKSYDQWGKQYDTNMRNYQHGAAREAAYRESMGAGEGTVKTSLTNRQIDILDRDSMYAGQLKTGPVSLTKENALAIQKDAELVQQGWAVEHILEQGASKPYLQALEKAGITYKIGPQIP